MSNNELLLLYEALAEPIGLVVQVSDFPLAQSRLYAARRKSGDPSLAVLQLRRSPYNPDGELWITRSDAVMLPPEAPNGA